MPSGDLLGNEGGGGGAMLVATSELMVCLISREEVDLPCKRWCVFLACDPP